MTPPRPKAKRIPREETKTVAADLEVRSPSSHKEMTYDMLIDRFYQAFIRDGKVDYAEVQKVAVHHEDFSLLVALDLARRGDSLGQLRVDAVLLSWARTFAKSFSSVLPATRRDINFPKRRCTTTPPSVLDKIKPPTR